MKRASVASPDGGTVELWTAPTEGEGTCAYLRHLDANGAPTDARGVSCEASLGDGEHVAGLSSTRGSRSGGGAVFSSSTAFAPHLKEGGTVHLGCGTGEPVTLYGRAPKGAVDVVVFQVDGTVTTAPVGDDGWFLVALSESTDPASLKTLEARSASGTPIVFIPLRLEKANMGPGTIVGGFDPSLERDSGAGVSTSNG